MERRLEGQIRELCNKLINAEEGSPEFETVAANLRAALSEHVKRLRSKLRDYPIVAERRSERD